MKFSRYVPRKIGNIFRVRPIFNTSSRAKENKVREGLNKSDRLQKESAALLVYN